jgi:branched-chain amino acid transport system ATP-binding protein
VLEIDTVAVNYGAVAALRGVSLTVSQGEIVAVIGANGAGKSTLLWTISGVLRPRSGTIRFRDRRIDGRRPESIARLGISLVPEGRRIFGHLTVRENIELARAAAKARGGGNHTEQLAAVVERFPFLANRLDSPAGQLSGGEQQQLAIGRALLTRPELIMLDEPSFGLAPLIVETVFDVLASLRDEGVTVLLIEQAAALAVELADRTYVLRNGEVETTGSRDELMSRTDFVSAYFGED